MSKVSIITPCYNSEAFIGRTIESVRAQTLTDWEHIVLDDGSTDDGAAIVETYTDNPRLHLIRQANGGVCNARNNGFKASSPDSEYLLFLDADDFLLPKMLATMAEYLDRHTDVGVVFCDFSLIDGNDKPLDYIHVPRLTPSIFGPQELRANEPLTPFVSIFCGAPIFPSNALIRRTLYAQTQGWDEKLGQHHEDLDLFSRIALLAPIHYLPRKLYSYRRHANQSTANLEGKSSRQGERFEMKWKYGQWLPRRHQKTVRSAWHYQEGCIRPFHRMKVANSLIKQGHLYTAVRHYAWAIMQIFKVVVSELTIYRH